MRCCAVLVRTPNQRDQPLEQNAECYAAARRRCISPGCFHRPPESNGLEALKTCVARICGRPPAWPRTDGVQDAFRQVALESGGEFRRVRATKLAGLYERHNQPRERIRRRIIPYRSLNLTTPQDASDRFGRSTHAPVQRRVNGWFELYPVPSFWFHGAFSSVGHAFTWAAQLDSLGIVAPGPSVE